MKESYILTLASAALLTAGVLAASKTVTATQAPPQRVTAGGSAIYGMLVYSDDYDIAEGLYELTKSGAINKWECPNKYEMIAGWLKDGKICGYAIDRYGYQTRGFIYEEIDFESGQLLKSTDIGVDGPYFSIATLDPGDNTIYGYGKDNEGNVSFMKAPATDPASISVVKAASRDDSFLSICHNPSDGKIYGITKNYDHQLVTVDHDGAQTSVMALNVDVCDDYVTGLVWSPVENLFYWNRYEGEESYTSTLCTINPVSKTLQSVKKYNDEMQFGVYFTTDKVVVGGQPSAPQLTSVNFAQGALSGDVQFTLPTTDVDGASLTGSLTWTVTVDDNAVKTGSDIPGASVTAHVGTLTEGNHTFAVMASANGIVSEKAFETAYIGMDTPVAPANVTLTEGGVSWDAVTEGVNGGYIDLANLEYEVKLDGVSVGTTKSNAMTDIIPSDKPLAWYQATVSAKCGDKTSAEAVSNRLLAGNPLELPVSLTPTAEQFATMQTFDLDGDSYSWKCRDGYMESQWSLSKDGGNDWIVLSPINFPDASAIYALSFEAMRKMAQTGRETLEVRIGTSPITDEMDQVIMPTFEALTDYTEYSKVFSVPVAGTYYIAFHATSMKWEAGIENGQCVRNIKVKRSGIVADSPAAVTDLTATPAEKGGLSATVKFKMPEKRHDGAPLTVATVTATVIGEESKTVSGAPGSTQVVSVATKQGQNVISVVTSVGDTEGTPSSIEVYTGVVIPGMVENLDFRISEDMLSVDMTWDAPTEGLTPGYVDPSTVTYKIYEAVQSFYDMTWELRGTTAPGVTTFRYSVDAGNQKVHTLVVMAENVAGHGDDMMGGEVLLGTPYPIPTGNDALLEDFENGSDHFQYTPWITYKSDEETSGYWSVWPAENVVNGGEGNALIGKPTEANSKGRLGMPAFATNDDPGSVALEFDALLNDNTPELTITALGYGSDEEVTIGKLPSGNFDTMQPILMVLPETFNDSPWIQLFFNTVYTKSTNLLVVDNVKVNKILLLGVTGIADEAACITASHGSICIKGMEGAEVTVFNIAGIKVAQRHGISACETISVTPGIYIVRAGDRQVKVAVK